MADIEASLDSPDPDDATHQPPRDVSETNSAVTRRSALGYSFFVLVLLVAAYLMGWSVGKSSGALAVPTQADVRGAASDPADSPGPQPAPVQVSNQRVAVTIDNNPVIGPDNAPVTIIEFTDFECFFCKQFHDETLSGLLKQYEGKIRFAYRNFPIRALHAYAQGAAEAAQCAFDQKKFWEYHDLLFQNIQQLTKDDLLTYATQLNLDKKTFQDCFDNGTHRRDVLNDYQSGVALGIGGVPTFFINGRMLVGAQPLSVFSAVIDAELATLSSATAVAPTKVP